MFSIIGNSGMAKLSHLEILHREIVKTPYGEPTDPLTFGKPNKYKTIFLARHDYGYNIPPHAVKLEDVNAVLDYSMIGTRKIIERVVEQNGN